MEVNTIVLQDLIENPITGEWGKEVVGKDDENLVKVIRTTNFTNVGVIDFSDVVVRNINKSKVDKKRLLFGDIIVEKSGGTDKNPVGRVVFCDDEIKDDIYLCNNFTTVFRVKKSLVDSKYLFYYLFFNYHRGGMLQYYNKTTGIQNLKIDSLIKKLKIPVPPLSTQQKIVQVLDKAQALIDKRREQIVLLDELTESIFYQMFGDIYTNSKKWEQKTFRDICKVNQGLQIPIAKRKNKFAENRYKYITIQYLNGKKETEYIENPSKSVLCRKDDILMTRTGNTGMVVTGVEGVFHNNFFIIDYNKKLLNKVYLVKYLRSNYIQADILRRAGSSTIPDLNHGDFYKIKILLPPLSLQNEFAEKVEVIEGQKERLRNSLKLLEDNYNNLMQRAFKGELFD